ncbi:MAG: HAD-IB family phosphatase [Thermoplasmata archaeon]
MEDYVIVCDFDGTMVEEQVDFMLFDKYASHFWHDLEEMRIDNLLSYEDAMKGEVMLLKCSEKEMEDFVNAHMTPRRGLIEFKKRSDDAHLPFYIVSAGLDYYIKLFIKNNKWENVEVIAPSLKKEGEYYTITYPVKPYSKGTVVDNIRSKNPSKKIVFIGDGSLDLEGALKSDIIFARRKLKDMLLERKNDFYSFEDFNDVIQVLFE